MSSVQVDGSTIWETSHPPDSGFGMESGIFIAASDTATFRIENDSPTGDKSVFIDAITIAQIDLDAPLSMVNPSFDDGKCTSDLPFLAII